MEKLKGRWDNDDHGTPCLVLYKNREKISDREVYEYCEEHGIRGKYLIHLVKIPSYTDNVPMDLYDPGKRKGNKPESCRLEMRRPSRRKAMDREKKTGGRPVSGPNEITVRD